MSLLQHCHAQEIHQARPALPAALGAKVRVASFAALALAAGLSTHPAQAAPQQWYLLTGGVSHHFEDTQARNRTWREQHPGLGLERRNVGEDWNLRLAGGLTQDSRSFWGGYAGAAYMRQWKRYGVGEVGLGVGAYAFYRSVSWSGKMALIPALLPTASLELNGGLGFNVIYVPPVAAKSMPALVHAQMSVKFQ